MKYRYFLLIFVLSAFSTTLVAYTGRNLEKNPVTHRAILVGSESATDRSKQIYEDFMKYAFVEQYVWRKLAKHRNPPDNYPSHWKHGIAATQSYPLEKPLEENDLAPDVELAIGRLTKWDISQPITFAIQGRGLAYRQAIENIDAVLANFRTSIPDISIQRVEPSEARFAQERSHAEITAYFFGGSHGRSKMFSLVGSTSRENLLETYELHDVFDIPFIIHKPDDDAAKQPMVDGWIRINQSHLPISAVCNPMGWSSEVPTQQFFYECLFSALGFPNRRNVAANNDHALTLLKILYSPRLQSGMTESEADPIVRELISEMFSN